MLKLYFLICWVLVLGGCFNPIYGRRTNMANEAEDELKADCNDLMALDDYKTIVKDYRSLFKLLLNELNRYSDDNHNLVLNIIGQMNQKSTLLKLVETPRYFLEKWPVTYIWLLNQKDLPILPRAQGLMPSTPEITKIDIGESMIFGVPSRSKLPELKLEIFFTKNNNDSLVEFRLQRLASSMELCASKDAVLIGVKVDYLRDRVPMNANYTLTMKLEKP